MSVFLTPLTSAPSTAATYFPQATPMACVPDSLYAPPRPSPTPTHNRKNEVEQSANQLVEHPHSNSPSRAVPKSRIENRRDLHVNCPLSPAPPPTSITTTEASAAPPNSPAKPSSNSSSPPSATTNLKSQIANPNSSTPSTPSPVAASATTISPAPSIAIPLTKSGSSPTSSTGSTMLYDRRDARLDLRRGLPPDE